MVKKRLNIYSILLPIVAVLLITTVVVLATSGAWFTSQKSGNSSTVSVVAQQNGEAAKTSKSIEIAQSSDTATNLLPGTGDAKKITIKNTSTIPVYLRAYITCVWENNVAGNEDVFSVLDFTLGSNWVAPGAANNATDNSKIQSGMLYYNGVVPTGNTTYSLLTSVNTTKAMPSKAIINVFVEVVQADTIGQSLFIDSDANITSWPLAN